MDYKLFLDSDIILDVVLQREDFISIVIPYLK